MRLCNGVEEYAEVMLEKLQNIADVERQQQTEQQKKQQDRKMGNAR